MANYAIAFDLNTKQMKSDGLSPGDITAVYQKEIPKALEACGFTAHPQGSLYHTEKEQDQIVAIMRLQSELSTNAPRFCQYVKRVHVFRMEEWSDVTELLANRQSDTSVDLDDELEDEQLDDAS